MHLFLKTWWENTKNHQEPLLNHHFLYHHLHFFGVAPYFQTLPSLKKSTSQALESLESRKFQSLPWQAAAALKVFDIFGYFLCLSQFSGATDCALKPGVCRFVRTPSEIFSCFREDENQLGFQTNPQADRCHMSQVPQNLLKIWGFRLGWNRNLQVFGDLR